jgi:hypothetical protein
MEKPDPGKKSNSGIKILEYITSRNAPKFVLYVVDALLSGLEKSRV